MKFLKSKEMLTNLSIAPSLRSMTKPTSKKLPPRLSTWILMESNAEHFLTREIFLELIELKPTRPTSSLRA